jgi:SnoaL-like domain
MVAGEGVVFADLFAADGVMAYPFAPPGHPSELRGRDAVRAFFAGAGPSRELFAMEGVQAQVWETNDPEVVITQITHHGQSNVTGAPYQFTALGTVTGAWLAGDAVAGAAGTVTCSMTVLMITGAGDGDPAGEDGAVDRALLSAAARPGRVDLRSRGCAFAVTSGWTDGQAVRELCGGCSCAGLAAVDTLSHLFNIFLRT